MAEKSETPNPYVGPVPFQTEQKDYFFGRDEEAAELLAHAVSERIVLFYAQSGSGKSSLVNARLIPQLTEKGRKVPGPDKTEYKVFLARVGGDLPGEVSADKVDNFFVFNVLLSLSETKKGLLNLGDGKKDAKAVLGHTLSSFAEEKALYPKDRPHWLILDQFEEIITAHPSQGEEKRKDFFRQLKVWMDRDPYLSVVLVMREDHLAGLDNFISLMPDRLSTRYRMERLKYKAAEEAVRLPALKAGREFQPGAAEHLVRELRQVRIADQNMTFTGEYVEPLFLQLVCFSLWKSLDEAKSTKTPEADRIITKRDVETLGDIDTALKKFYSDAVKRVADKTGTSEMAIRRWFGETLITATGVRAQVNRGLLKSGDLRNTVVDQLLNVEHIVRLEDARGGKWYELSHDRFIAPIQQSNEEWLTRGGGDSELARAARLWNKSEKDESFLYRGQLLQKAQSRYEKNKEAAGPLEAEFLNASLRAEANRTKKYRSLMVVLVALVLLFLVSAVLAFSQRGEALEKTNEAKLEREKAEKALEEYKQLQEQNARLQAEALKQAQDSKWQAELLVQLKDQALQQKEKERLRADHKAKQYARQVALTNVEKTQREKERIKAIRSVSDLAASDFSSSKRQCDFTGVCTTNDEIVGPVRWRSRPQGGFEFVDDWTQKNIVTIEIPELKGKRTLTGDAFDGRVAFYRGAIESLKNAWEEISRDKLLDLVTGWEGSTDITNYKPPFPENHSLGTAFDIDLVSNVESATRTRINNLLAILRRNGFKASRMGPNAYHVEYMGSSSRNASN
jgi:hypothetical protein